MSSLLMVLAMWWRWADGTNKIFGGHKIHIWSGLGVALAYVAAYVGTGSLLLSIPVAAVASWSILSGFKKLGCSGWDDTSGMLIRFGLPGAVVVAVMGTAWAFGYAEISIGWPIYFLLQLQIAYAYKLQIEEAARAYAGAAIIGALIML